MVTSVGNSPFALLATAVLSKPFVGRLHETTSAASSVILVALFNYKEGVDRRVAPEVSLGLNDWYMGYGHRWTMIQMIW